MRRERVRGDAERFRLLAETAHEFTASGDDLDELVSTVARRTSEIFDAYSAVSLVAANRAWMRPLAIHDTDESTLSAIRAMVTAPFPLDTFPHGPALSAGEIVETDGLSPEILQQRFPNPSDQEAIRALELRHVLFVPLRARSELIGMIVLVRHGVDAERFSAEDKATAHSLGDLAALALANSQLLQRSRSQARERRQVNLELRRASELARQFAEAVARPQELYDDIARAVREQGADIGILRLVSEDGQWLENQGSASHVDDAMTAKIIDVLRSSRLRVSEWIGRSAITTGMPTRVGPLPPEAVRTAFPAEFAEVLDSLQPTSFAVVPLIGHDGIVGVSISVRRGAAFEDGELVVLERIAAHAAEAVSNARLLERLNRELVNRQRLVGRQRLLSELSRQFAEATSDLERLLETVAKRLQEEVGDGCVIRLLTPDGAAFDERAWAALPPEILAHRKGGAPPEPRVGVGVTGRVVETGETILIPEWDDRMLATVDAQDRAYVARLGLRSMLACPLRVHGRVVGVITMLRIRAGQPYGHEDRRLVEDVAMHAGLALSNARLLRDRAKEIAERERLAHRLQKVSGLAREFAAATPNIGALKELIARRVSELLGDLCVVRSMDPDTQQFDHDGGCFHPDPALRELASRLLRSTPIRYGEGIAGRVAATGVPLRASIAPHDFALMSPDFAEFIHSMGISSMICVPFRVAGRVAGVISAARGSGGMPYTDADVASLEDLAAHAALAIANSQMLAAAKAELVERVHHEELLRRGFLEAAPDAVLIVDERDRILLVNTRAEQLFGYTREELGRMTMGELVPDGTPQELVGVCKDRSRFAADVTQSRIETPSGPLIAAAVRDVSERRREYEERTRRTQEASRLKSEFLANMSHELRTPLNAIIGFTSLIHAGKTGAVSEVQREYLGDILTSSRHLLQLINDVLDLSKVEAGRLDIRIERVDLAKVTGEVHSIVKGLLAENGVRLSVQIPPDIGEVELDPRLLKQVMYNFLSNAIKFTPEGGRVTLAISAPDPANVLIDVTDTGVGIGETDLGRLFTEFQQLDRVGPREHKGTGLGLALTKRIVEAQGGAVAARSVVGEGSTFSAKLPRRPRETRETG